MSALKLFVHNQQNQHDSSLAKTVTFALTHFLVAFTVAFVLTGDILIGGLIAMVEPAINTVVYFFHEKLWARRQQRRQATCSAVSCAGRMPQAIDFRPVGG